jgi:hypothetical protein
VQSVTLTCDGAAGRPVLLRAIGRGLAPFSAAKCLPTPVLSLARDGRTRAEDCGSAIASPMLELAQQLGAFPVIPTGVRSFTNYGAALATKLEPGITTLTTRSGDRDAGLALFELYSVGVGASAPRVREISLRGQTGPGDDLLVLGFIIEGETSLRVRVGTEPTALRLDMRAGGNATGLAPDSRQRGAPDERVFHLPPGLYTATVSASGTAPSPARVDLYVED